MGERMRHSAWLGALTLFCGVAVLPACGSESSVREERKQPETPEPLAFIDTELPLAFVGRPYEATVGVRGGSGIIDRWVPVAGQLPRRLRLQQDFELEGGTGAVISGTPEEAGRSLFTVLVVDVSGEEVSADFTIDVLGPVNIVTMAVPPATVGEPYEFGFSADGGLPPYTWTISGLPEGLSADGEGRVSGTTLACASARVAVSVTDASGDPEQTARAEFDLVLEDRALSIVTTSLPAGRQQRPYEAFVETALGCQTDFQWSWIGGIAGGLQLDTLEDGRGRLWGLPRESRTYEARFRVVSNGGDEATVELPLDIEEGAPPLQFETNAVLPRAEEKLEYRAELKAIGGSEGVGGTYEWSVNAEDLPDGLALGPGDTPQTAVIEGVPERAAAFEFEVTVSDRYDELGLTVQQSRTFQLDVRPPVLRIRALNPPIAKVDELYRLEVCADNGSGRDYIWSVVEGRLPPRLDLVRDGAPCTEIVGTPTYPGTYTATVSMADTFVGRPVEEPMAVVIEVTGPARPLRLAAASPTGYQYNPVDLLVRTTGGAERGRTYSVVGGSLPDGLSLSPEGSITGSPTELGTTSYTLRVEDELGLVDERTYDFTVERPLHITTIELPRPVPDEPYVTTLEATGGSGSGYDWSLVQGALPSGFTLSTLSDGRGELRGTTPNRETSAFRLQVEDDLGNTYVRTYLVRPREEQRWAALIGELDGDEWVDVALSPTDGSTRAASLVEPTGEGGLVYQRLENTRTASLQFSPDGSKMVVFGDWGTGSSSQVHLVDVSGASPGTPEGASTTLVGSFSGLSSLGWGQLSDRVFYQPRSTNRLSYFEVTSTGVGRSYQASSSNDSVGWYYLANDDNWISYIDNFSLNLKLVDLSGSTPAAAETVCTRSSFGSCSSRGLYVRSGLFRNGFETWSSQQFFFLDQDPPAQLQTIYSVDLAAGPPFTPVEVSPNLPAGRAVEGFDFDPFGSRLVFATFDGAVYSVDVSNRPQFKPQLIAELATPGAYEMLFGSNEEVLLLGDYDASTSYDELFTSDVTPSTPSPIVKVSGEPNVSCSDYHISDIRWGFGGDFVFFEANFDDCARPDYYAVNVSQPAPAPRIRMTTDTVRGSRYGVDRESQHVVIVSGTSLYYFDVLDPQAGLRQIVDARTAGSPAAHDVHWTRGSERIVYRGTSGDAYIAGIAGDVPATPGVLNANTTDIVREVVLQP